MKTLVMGGINIHQSPLTRRQGSCPWLGRLFFVAFFSICAASLTAQETISHQREGNHVVFTLEERPVAVSLQGLVASDGRWLNLVTRKNPRVTLSRIKIPARWRQAELRVTATYGSKDATRQEIPHQYVPGSRSITFLAAAGARLFSVEAKENAQSKWKRVSTVASPEAPTTVQVSLPLSMPEGAQIRVVAVSGQRKTFPRLATPLSPLLRGGPAAFAARLEAVAQPLFSLQTTAAGLTPPADSGKAAPSIEESDVWRIHGDKIYFFNRLRGFQVIDAMDRARPRLAGQLAMAGVGEEMYILGPSGGPATGAILLTSVPWKPDQPSATRINRLSLSGDNLDLAASLDLPGDYVESRLIGGMLHVVTRSGPWNAGHQGWVSETFVNSIDLSQSNVLVAAPTKTLPFEATVVGSTGKYLWVAGTSPLNGWMGGDRLAAFPIKPDGSLLDALESEVGGRIQDKFKVGDTSGGLAVVVQSWTQPDWVQKTSVETYREQEGALALEANLEVVRGEALFASRFAGDRLYAVTFEQVDPLWIIDLSDPAKPEIKGHLEVPGWSSFIEPLGDVLLAVGRDGGRVQVSMFDVADPAKPALAQRVDVGEGWSWSEAEWNEKAVRILPEAGLILVPVVESVGNTVSNRVGLVEFDAAKRTLVKRGTIAHAFVPRRAALMPEATIASLSNRELLLVDAANRDLPSLTGKLSLAHSVDRIVLHQGTALLFENGQTGWPGSERNSTLRIADAADTEKVIAEISLPCEEVAAAAVFGNRLVLVERPALPFLWLGVSSEIDKAASTAHLSVWSLDEPRRPLLVGRTALPQNAAAGEIDLLPVDGSRAAVLARDRGSNFLVRPLPVVMPAIADAAWSVAVSPARIAPPYWGWGAQSLRVSITQIDGSAPSLVGSWELADDSCTEISKIYSAGDLGDLLVFSFAKREAIPASAGNAFWSDWATRHWLQILDLADPGVPRPWAPVQLPGELLGASWLQREGGLLFARSHDRVAALGFDGENASVVAELPVSSTICVQGSSVYFPDETGMAEWVFSEKARRWQRQTGWEFDASGGIYQLHAVDGALLAGGYNHVWVLGEEGSVTASALLPGADLGAAVSDEAVILAPAGEFGALRLR